MRLKTHVGYVYREPARLPRKVLFLSYAGGGRCRVFDFGGDPLYCTVPRERIGEEWAARPGQRCLNL